MQGYGWALLLELSGESHYSPVNASTTASRPPPHDSGPEWIVAPFLYRTFIDYPSPVSLAHYASGPTHLALIHVDVYRTAQYWHGASHGRGRWLVGGVLAARRPRATQETPTVPLAPRYQWPSLLLLTNTTSRPTFRSRRNSPVSESTRSAEVLLQPLGALPLPDGEECRMVAA